VFDPFAAPQLQTFGCDYPRSQSLALGLALTAAPQLIAQTHIAGTWAAASKLHFQWFDINRHNMPVRLFFPLAAALFR